MWIYILLIISAIASGSVVFLLKPGDHRFQKFLLAFSGAFLIGITFLTLVPEVFSHATAYTGLFVLAGFLLQLLLELITEGAEHGHVHQHHEDEKASPFLLLTGLCIHAFLEGMPLSGTDSAHLRGSLVTGIVIHNIPITMTLAGLFLHYGCSRLKTLIYLVIFSMMTPLGAGISYLADMAELASMEQYFEYILAVVIGIFLHVSTTILFEAEENHRYNVQKFLTIVAGLIIAFAVSGSHVHVH